MSKNKKRIFAIAAAMAVVLGLGLSLGGWAMAKHAEDVRRQAEVDAWTAKMKIVAQNVTRDPILAATLAEDADYMASLNALADFLGYELKETMGDKK